MSVVRPSIARDERVHQILAGRNDVGTTRDQVYEVLHAEDPNVSPGQAYLCLNRLQADDPTRVRKEQRKGITYWYALGY